MRKKRLEEMLVLTGALLALSWTLAMNSFGESPRESASYADAVSQERHYPWTGKAYRECNQACLYKKANENLTVQMLYTLNLIDELDGAKEAVRRSTLGDFCLDNEDGNECFARYKAKAKITLLGIRRGIIENKAMVGKLKVDKGARVGPQGEFARGFLPTLLQLENQLGARGPAEAGKFAQSPSAMSLEAMTKYYSDEFFRINELVSRDYEDWVSKFPVEPAKEDFILFREEKRDRRDPESEVLLIPKMNCGPRLDKMCFDEAKYTLALNTYKDQIKDAIGSKKIKFWATERELYKEKHPEGKRSAILQPLGPKDTIGTGLSQKAYKDAVRALNRTTQQAQGKRGQTAIAPKEKGGPSYVLPGTPGAIDQVGSSAELERQREEALDDEAPPPQTGAAAKDLSVSVQPRDDTTDPTAKDQFLDETLSLDPNK